MINPDPKFHQAAETRALVTGTSGVILAVAEITVAVLTAAHVLSIPEILTMGLIIPTLGLVLQPVICIAVGVGILAGLLVLIGFGLANKHAEDKQQASAFNYHNDDSGDSSLGLH